MLCNVCSAVFCGGWCGARRLERNASSSPEGAAPLRYLSVCWLLSIVSLPAVDSVTTMSMVDEHRNESLARAAGWAVFNLLSHCCRCLVVVLAGLSQRPPVSTAPKAPPPSCILPSHGHARCQSWASGYWDLDALLPGRSADRDRGRDDGASRPAGVLERLPLSSSRLWVQMDPQSVLPQKKPREGPFLLRLTQ